MRWIVSNIAYSQLASVDKDVVKAAFRSQGSFGLGSPYLIDETIPVTPVANYKSFAQFDIDVHQNKIHPDYKWVLYDPEVWEYTPVDEQDNPWFYIQNFGQLARSEGYRIICAPARDLAYAPDSVYPRNAGESADHWYIRTELAETVAEYCDLLSVQNQADTVNVPEFTWLYDNANLHALDANPYITIFAAVSTAYGTANQMAEAAKSVDADGFWLNVITSKDPDAPKKAINFLKNMGC